VRIFPRLGFFWTLPSGPGYYSLLDLLRGNARETPPRFPYPPTGAMAFPFFDADWRFLEDPNNTQHDFLDPVKRIHLADNWLLSLGGEFRWRHMDEVDSRLTARDNTYELVRTRAYADLWYRDLFRVYVEYLDAQSFNEDLAPLPIDVDRSDLLNAFVDVKIYDDGYPAYLRVGRQELLYGSERLISPLDWANTRRTFEGVKAFRQGEKFDVDAFWVSPVVPDPSHFDSVNDKVNFAGVWTTYRPRRGTFFDLYYLLLHNTSPAANTSITSPPPAFYVSTVGSRYAGNYYGWLYDVEGMYQFGERGPQPISAGAYTAGAGYHFRNLPMNPQVWFYYDYASGDHNPARGHYFGTFNQLFPFGHLYFGFLDLVGRQNIHDLNAHLGLYPTNWTFFWVQFHHFELDSARDALYSPASTIERRDPTGRAGVSVGDEIDLLMNFHLDSHQDVVVGWSKLYAGTFIKRTGPAVSPELFYVQYTFRW
jgi:hypothetical protein